MFLLCLFTKIATAHNYTSTAYDNVTTAQNNVTTAHKDITTAHNNVTTAHNNYSVSQALRHSARSFTLTVAVNVCGVCHEPYSFIS